MEKTNFLQIFSKFFLWKSCEEIGNFFGRNREVLDPLSFSTILPQNFPTNRFYLILENLITDQLLLNFP